MISLETPWLVTRSRSGFEMKVHQQLERLGIESVVPQMRTKMRDPKTHRPVIAAKPCFIGYNFLRLGESHDRAELTNISYFIDVLRFGSQQAFLPADEMSRVCLLLDSDGPVYGRVELIPGQRVRVVKGSMTGVVGEFIRNRGEDQFVVNIPMFGRSLATPLPFDWVAPLEAVPL